MGLHSNSTLKSTEGISAFTSHLCIISTLLWRLPHLKSTFIPQFSLILTYQFLLWHCSHLCSDVVPSITCQAVDWDDFLDCLLKAQIRFDLVKLLWQLRITSWCINYIYKAVNSAMLGQSLTYINTSSGVINYIGISKTSDTTFVQSGVKNISLGLDWEVSVRS